MHCAGGHDRTGTLAFLLNGLLGVEEDDLCRDWEASVFSDAGMKFSSDCIVRLLGYLKTMPGSTLQERIEAYVKGCGVTDAEIAAFRAIMKVSGIVRLHDGSNCGIILPAGCGGESPVAGAIGWELALMFIRSFSGCFGGMSLLRSKICDKMSAVRGQNRVDYVFTRV